MAVDDVCIRLVTYAILFILAFWCAAIAAPIMWRLEYDRQYHWPVTTCLVSKWNCCRISCGKSGCSYQPRWIVRFNKTNGLEHTGSYYGQDDVWYRPRDAAEERMFDHPENTSFVCQYDPQFTDSYRYVAEPGQFHTNDYLIWTIVMYAVGIPLCVLPFLGWLIYLLVKKANCGSISCDCCRRKHTYQPRTRGIAAPMAYTPPPSEPTIITPPAPIPEAPRPDPFAERANMDTPATVLVPLDDIPPSQPVASDESGSNSGKGDMPVY